MWKQKKVVAEPKPLPRINDMGLYKAYMQYTVGRPGKKNVRISEWERNEIVRLYKQGWTQSRISIEIGRAEVSVRDVLCKEGLTIRKKGNFRDDITAEMVIELQEKGFTQIEIAKKLGCSTTLLQNRLNQAMGDKKKNDTRDSDGDSHNDSDSSTFGGRV